MEKKIGNIIKVVFICLLIIFIFIYIFYENGYFAYMNHKKSVLTNEMIKQFEKDVSEGKEVDINDYLVSEKDYSNKISKASLRLSNYVGGYVKKTLGNLFKSVNKLIE